MARLFKSLTLGIDTAPNSSITINKAGTGTTVPLFSDAAGTVSVANPTVFNAQGMLEVYLANGYVDLVIGSPISATISDVEHQLVGNDNRIVLVNDGTDWGARINAADTQLGANPGIIEIHGGGAFSTTAIINAYHTVIIGPGTYTSTVTVGTNGAMFRPKSNTAIIGSGWDTILTESTGSNDNSFCIIQGYQEALDAKATSENRYVANLQFKGSARTDFQSATCACSIGNLSHGRYENLWFNNVHAGGMWIGGDSSTGNHADGIVVTGCLFQTIASQNFAIVNGKNITIQNSIFRDTEQVGGPGGAPVDFETNSGTDIIQNLSIIGCLFDSRGSPGGANGIVIQASSQSQAAGIIVQGNSILGGPLSNGIYLSTVRDVLLIGNKVVGASQNGIYTTGCTKCSIINNTVLQSGGGGFAGIKLDTGTTYTNVIGNVVEKDGAGDNTIVELDTADNNMIAFNFAAGGYSTVGPNTMSIMNVPQGAAI